MGRFLCSGQCGVHGYSNISNKTSGGMCSAQQYSCGEPGAEYLPGEPGAEYSRGEPGA